MCIGYKLNNEIIDYFPASTTDLAGCQPVYEELKGWQTPLTDIRQFDQLPEAARGYVARMEEHVGCPANIICVGPKREQTIFKDPIL
jgi:adenylosuccinate synthase